MARCELCESERDVERVSVAFENEDGSYGPGTKMVLLCAECREDCS